MNTDYLEQLTAGSRSSLESLQALNNINTRTLMKLTELQFQFASINQEFSVEQSRLFTSTTNFTDLVAAETDLAKDYSEKATAIIQQANEILTESRDEVISWLEKGFENPGLTPEKKPAGRTTRKSG